MMKKRSERGDRTLRTLRLGTALAALCSFALAGAALGSTGGQRPESDSPPGGPANAPAAAERTAVLDSASTLFDYVAYAIAENPALQALVKLHEAADRIPPQVRALPDPMFSFSQFVESPDMRVEGQERMLMLSQHFPFFGKRRLMGDMAQKEADMAGKMVETKLLDLVTAVRNAYYDYYRVHHVLRVTREEKIVLTHMQQVAQVKYASGLVSQQDVLKAQLSVSDLDDRLTRLSQELVTVTAHFNQLLNRDPGAPLALPRIEPIEIDDRDLGPLYEAAEKRRPEIAATHLSIEKAEKARKLAKREYYPDLSLSLGYTFVGEKMDMLAAGNANDMLQFSTAINIPIWYGKLRAAVGESEAMIASARYERDAVRTEIRMEIRDAQSRVRSARDLVRLYEDVIIPQAEQTFVASEAGYQTGKVDFLNYLDSERALLSFKQTYHTLLADLGRELAAFERALGTSLERFTHP